MLDPSGADRSPTITSTHADANVTQLGPGSAPARDSLLEVDYKDLHIRIGQIAGQVLIKAIGDARFLACIILVLLAAAFGLDVWKMVPWLLRGGP